METREMLLGRRRRRRHSKNSKFHIHCAMNNVDVDRVAKVRFHVRKERRKKKNRKSEEEEEIMMLFGFWGDNRLRTIL